MKKFFLLIGIGLSIICILFCIFFVRNEEQMIINEFLKIREQDVKNTIGKIVVEEVYVCNKNFAKVKVYSEVKDKTLSESVIIYIYQDRIVDESFEYIDEEICLSKKEYESRPRISPIQEDVSENVKEQIHPEWNEEEYVSCLKKNKEIKMEKELVKSKKEAVDLTCKQESKKISKLGLYRINQRIN